MLRIRLKRVGRKHDPSYRIVVTEKHRSPKSGKYVEKIGFYDPRSDTREVNSERAQYWLGEGAQPSDTVHNILVSEGIIDAEKVNPLPKKTPQEKAEQEKSGSKTDEEDTKETVEESQAGAQGASSVKEAGVEASGSEPVPNHPDASGDAEQESRPDEGNSEESIEKAEESKGGEVPSDAAGEKEKGESGGEVEDGKTS